ncbi:MAG: hypothetical protein WA208_09755, partial [Thermoanaerobaculia bacterium]
TGVANVVAFTRADDILVMVPRLTTQIASAPKQPLGDVWGDRSIDLRGRWRNVFTSEVVEGSPLRLADVFATFPVAMFERE